MTDPIADMLSRIRNAVTAKQTRVDMPASRLKTEIARILQDEGYIQGFKVLDEAATKTAPATKSLRLFLKYGPHGEKLITGVQRISRPGRLMRCTPVISFSPCGPYLRNSRSDLVAGIVFVAASSSTLKPWM